MFDRADSSVFEIFIDIIEKVFPSLSCYSFGLLFRKKSKKSSGRVVLAEVCQPSKLLSYFARNDSGNPYDLLIVIDEMVWAVADRADRERIIRHELRHVSVNEKGLVRLVGHDFEDFHEEVKLNSDAPDWASRLVELAAAGYDQVKSGQPDPREVRKIEEEPPAEVVREPQRQVQIEAAVPDKGQVKIGKGQAKVSKGDILSKKEPKKDKPSVDVVNDADGINAKLDAIARKRGLLKS